MNLLNSEAKYIWSVKYQSAFDNVKALLCYSPILAAPRLEEPFHLQVDPSCIRAGAMLLQTDDLGIQHSVSYFF